MRFIQATIDSFGKWVDTTFDFSESGIFCFYGENESGKSTLHQFLLYMLFGLPPRKRQAFSPKGRNGIGGSLTIQDKTLKEITIRRQEGQCECLLDNGEIKNEDWWKEQLDSLTRETYRSIYAFAATDLSSIQTMKQNDLSDLLFSVGLTGSTAIYRVEKELQSRLDSLYKKQGSKPIINEQIVKVAATYEQMQDGKNQEAEYESLNEQIVELERTLQSIQAELALRQKDLITIEKTKQVIPLIQSYFISKEKLNCLPDKISFPDQGLKRYQTLREELLPHKSEIQILKQKYVEDEAAYKQLKNQLFPNTVIQQAKTLLNKKNDYDQRVFKIEQLDTELEELKDTYRAFLQQLDWNSDETVDIILPFHLETTWLELNEQQLKVYDEQRRLEEELHLLKEKRKRTTTEESKIQENMLSKEEVHEIQKSLEEDKLSNEYMVQQDKWLTWENNQKRITKNVLSLAIGLAILACLFALWIGHSFFYGLALVILFGGGMQYVYSKNNKKVMNQVMHDAGVGKALTEQQRIKYEEMLQKEHALKQQLLTLTNELRQLDFTDIQLQERHQLLTQRKLQLKDRLETERFQYPFLKTVDVAYWLDLLKLVRELKNVETEIQKLKLNISSFQMENGEVDNALRQFPHGANFSELENFLENERVKEQSLKQYATSKTKTIERLAEKKEELTVYQKEITKIFATVGVESEEGFYEKASQLEMKQSLETEIAKLQSQITGLFPAAYAQELFQSNIDETELESNELLIKKQMKDLEEKLAINNKHLATLEMKVKALESSDGISALQHRFHLERGQLNEQAQAWSMLKIAHAVLNKAKETFQEKHLSDVISFTTEYFTHLTGGKYRAVHAPTKTKLFQVDGKDEIRYTVDELSQGTVDQLYIALRFAIARVMNTTFDIPLLVDDAFVHFDDIRTEQAVGLLAEVATSQQVIFLTCKKAVSEMIERENNKIKTFN